MILYRHADPRFPFLWESADQPAARWHDTGEGPVHYFADTPDGAWAEFIRHEGIQSEAELANVRRALWAIEAPDDIKFARPALGESVLTGGLETYEQCRIEARRLRGEGATALTAPSAALTEGGARGWKVDSGLQPAPDRDGTVVVLFGPQPNLTGWPAAVEGRPAGDLLQRVRQL
jgi:RES domain